ncbi:single-stranded DNA-binding protein [Ruminococcus sp. AF21-42]|nr:single-stranded DNA-binding protein [Ruminococcus sp. AF21-42]
MNTIVLMGRLARDPETKLASTQKGQTKVSRFPLVVKRNRTSKAFVVMITAYGNNAEFVEKYLEKMIYKPIRKLLHLRREKNWMNFIRQLK